MRKGIYLAVAQMMDGIHADAEECCGFAAGEQSRLGDLDVLPLGLVLDLGVVHR
jgi:hypothetical protein